MFLGVASFDQNLCAWGTQLTSSCLVKDMFWYTNCPTKHTNPNLTASPPGPFCRSCGIPTVSQGLAKTGLYSGGGDTMFFQLEDPVEAGHQVTCELVVPNGDSNLFVKFGSIPNVATRDCDCASTLEGPFDEDCTTAPAPTNTTVYIAVDFAKDSSNITLYCFINDIHCVHENQPCIQNEDCCGTMVCDGNETIANRCVPCDRPKPCETARCATSNKPCKQSRSPCCRRFACDDSLNRCERKRF
jgi:hypothetical protein